GVAAEGPTTLDELEAFLASRSDATAALDRVDGGEVGDGRDAADADATGADRPAGRRRRGDQAEPEVVTSLFARIRADAEVFGDPLPSEEPPTDEELTELVAAAEAANAAADAPSDAEQPGEAALAVEAADAAVPEAPSEVPAVADDGQPDVASSRALALAGPER